jgi:histidyl-tRNA synthetase
LYGFQPLETPAFENIETLMGKYGEEGDKLIFKILNNGLDNESKKQAVVTGFEEVLQGKTNRDLTSRALRYDLTIPFARYVAMNYKQLLMPFKRYQMQSVWRADRPQKGRYREFFQCDADVVGTRSIITEVEFAEIYQRVFHQLQLPAEINVNSRNILLGLADLCEVQDASTITVAIDKLDKIGVDGVEEELKKKNLAEEKILIIRDYLSISGSIGEKISVLKKLLRSPAAQKGIKEVETFFQYLDGDKNFDHISLDLTLARGLDYYTGIIFEVKIPGIKVGSVGGGGRYDNLTSLFGVDDIPGSGISFGIDRIYDCIQELNLFPAGNDNTPYALFMNLGAKESMVSFKLMQQLRSAGISCEIFYDQAKLDKQFKYATKKNIPYAVIIGTREIEKRIVMVKELKTGHQSELSFDRLLPFFLTIHN